jgi:hypothetical protein
MHTACMENDMRTRVAMILALYHLRTVRELRQKIAHLKRAPDTERAVLLLELAVAAYEHKCNND